MSDKTDSTPYFAGPFQSKAYIEAFYLTLLNREPEPAALSEQIRSVNVQEYLVSMSRSLEFEEQWSGCEVWGSSALRDLLNREPPGEWTEGEWITVLTGLFVAMSHRARSNHDGLSRRQEEATRSIHENLSRIEKTLQEAREEFGRSMLEIEARFDRRRTAKDERLTKEHIALNRRLASIEERIYPAANLDIEGCKTYAIAENVLLIRSSYGSFLVIRPDLVGGVLGRGEFWDPHVKSVIDRFADSDRVAIDAGAFIGFHSVYLASKFKKVYAFEPQKFVWRLAVGNLALNDVTNVEMLNAALYSQDTRLAIAAADEQQIALPKNGADIDYSAIGNAAAVSFAESDPSSSDGVPAHKLDNLGIKNVGFIKIDAQGCDLHVLRGASEIIKRDRPVITFEFEEKLSSFHGSSWSNYDEFFKEHGYNLSETAHSGPDQWDYLALPREK